MEIKSFFEKNENQNFMSINYPRSCQKNIYVKGRRNFQINKVKSSIFLKKVVVIFYLQRSINISQRKNKTITYC